MSEWQPIETAPKEGQRVLVCFVDDVHRETWHFENTACQVATFRGRYVRPIYELDCESINGYLKVTLDASSVTHWMPLPEPPK